MNHIARFVFSLPITLPMLGFATFLDFVLSPISHKLKEDYPEKIAQAAFEIMGV